MNWVSFWLHWIGKICLQECFLFLTSSHCCIQLFQNILNSNELQFPQNVVEELHADCIDLCKSLLRQNPGNLLPQFLTLYFSSYTPFGFWSNKSNQASKLLYLNITFEMEFACMGVQLGVCVCAPWLLGSLFSLADAYVSQMLQHWVLFQIHFLFHFSQTVGNSFFLMLNWKST